MHVRLTTTPSVPSPGDASFATPSHSRDGSPTPTPGGTLRSSDEEGQLDYTARLLAEPSTAAPTQGLGAVVPLTAAAFSIALSIRSASEGGLEVFTINAAVHREVTAKHEAIRQRPPHNTPRTPLLTPGC